MKKREIITFETSQDEQGIIDTTFQLMMKILTVSGFPDDEIAQHVASNLAVENWAKTKEEMRKRGISEEIRCLLSASKKSIAQKVCKEIILTHESFSDFVFLSKEEGYTHELLTADFLPDGILEEDLPELIQFEEGRELYVKGETNLTEAQLKSVIKHRKKIHLHVFGNGELWHCFYFTFSDMRGDHWRSQHLHYVSNLWTLEKDYVISALMDSRKHNQVGDHIKYSMPENKNKNLTVPTLPSSKKSEKPE
jgi:hypothetical protein